MVMTFYLFISQEMKKFSTKSLQKEIMSSMLQPSTTILTSSRKYLPNSLPLLWRQDKKNETVLHIASNEGHVEVATLAGETPLHLTAESGFQCALLEILESCTRPSYAGPCGRTTPCINNSWIYRYIAYLPAGSTNDWTTVFHIAVTEGNTSMMEELLRHNPDCWEMLNSKGQNEIHKDNDGNTPLHMLSASSCYVPELIDHPREMKMAFNKENETPQDATLAYSWSRDRDRIECHLLRVGRMGRHDFKIGLQNKEKPKDEVETGDQTQQQEQKTEKKSKKMIDKVVKAAQTHLIVATLVVTVTFAAGFTLPGGFDSNPSPNQGMAILTRKAAFKAFIITDAIAFVCSAGAVFSYFAMVANAAFFQEVRAVRRLYMIATGLQLLALAAVVLAFVTGIYATLAHAIGLAITVSSIGCISFLIYFYMLFMTFDWKSL
ncbi:hypothetical protein RND71_014422 [Anisodus tanguticus]|uniref:PGG domain-containing protein n=1 Tax=Anisodus tanguticus TaxID=243964 RepID=A0AAE1SBR8_9SOLA|nr:hypothetical protein RND71_014422 [Anisodus tanguticus]